MNHKTSENGLKSWKSVLLRLLGLMALTASLCSCGVYQVGDAMLHPDDDNKNLTAAMDIMIPPFLITGYIPPTSHQDVKTPPSNAELILNRNDGKMTAERARQILAAMDQIFPRSAIKNRAEIESQIGPPDKTVVRFGKNIDVYQVHAPSGIEERWLVLN